VLPRSRDAKYLGAAVVTVVLQAIRGLTVPPAKTHLLPRVALRFTMLVGGLPRGGAEELFRLHP
jgi:hypothetical protein